VRLYTGDIIYTESTVGSEPVGVSDVWGWCLGNGD